MLFFYFEPYQLLTLLIIHEIMLALLIHSNNHPYQLSYNLILLTHQNISNPITINKLSCPLILQAFIAILMSLISSLIIYNNYILISHSILVYLMIK